MIIDINSNDYKVNSNEFNKITHNEFNNLLLREKSGLYERLVSLLVELSKSLSISQSLFLKQTHGGFIPINCSSQFENMYVTAKDDIHKQNIQYNINLYKIDNIIFYEEDKLTNNLIIYSEKAEHIELQLIDNYNPVILTSLSPKLLKKYSHILELTNTNLHLYIPDQLFEKFYNEFYYFIKDDKLEYDNLIHLCIMVKNGGPQFCDMLLQNMHLIDRWTILDTGSTDDTIKIIDELLINKKKGNLYQEPFINFRDSRNRLLDLAGKDCKYIMMLDDTYTINGDLRAFLNEVRDDQLADSFTLYIKSDDVEYGSNRIIKSDKGLRYLYKIHEVIQDKNNLNVVIPTTNAHIVDGRFDYMEKRTMGRKEMDLKLLYEELEDDPNNSRTHYYLAQTYNLLEKYDDAYKWFIERMNHPNKGFIQEKIDAVFEAGRISNFKLNKPWKECEDLYLKAYDLDNSRPESLYFIGIHYYLEKDNITAFKYFKKAFEIGYPVHCQYSLKPTLSYHFVPKFLSQLCYEFNDYVLGEQCCKLFLEKKIMGTDYYDIMVSWYNIFVNLNKMNINNFVSLKQIEDKPLLCFVADGGFTSWTGSDILVKGIGGSETYIIEMARHIQLHGYYKVIVFCNTPNEEHTLFEDVEYIPLNKFHNFVKNTYINTCIVSRFSEYIPVAINGQTENVYLVLHDLGPSGLVIPIHNKLKKIFCLSEWHVSYFLNQFPQFKDITVPFYYGIDTNKFNSNLIDYTNTETNNINLKVSVIKTPYKFIYSSFPNRGLYELLQMWPKIVERFPEANLHIYSDVNGKWVNSVAPELMTNIRALLEDYCKDEKLNIKCYGWVSKTELAEAWKTSEYWFYPCTFMETFCLTAVEAALSKTLAISNGLAALQNTVGDRGICIEGDTTTSEWQEKALDALFKIMDYSNIEKKNNLISNNYKWASQMSWSNQANKLLTKYLISNTNVTITIDKMIETICSVKLETNNNDFHILKIGAFKGNVPNDIMFNTINIESKIIFVEPVPSYYYELKENYNRKFPNNKFIYLNDAVSDKNEKIQIYYPSKSNNYTELPWWIDQLASSNNKHCEDHGYKVDLDLININAITVKQIIENYNIQGLFCLMIDTEGSDFKILMNIDFTTFKPSYIVFENMHLTSYHNRGQNYNILIEHLSTFGYKVLHENESDTLVGLSNSI